MKKLFTSFAIVALLIGTLTIDANAQNHNRRNNRRTRRAAKTEVITTNVRPEAATIELNAAPTDAKKTDVEAKKPETNVNAIPVDTKKPEVEAKKPEVEAKKPETNVNAVPVEAPGAKAVKEVRNATTPKEGADAKKPEGKVSVNPGDTKEPTGEQKLEINPEENWEEVIKNYEIAVDDCVSLYKEVKSDEKGSKELQAKYDESLTNVETLGAKIETALPEMPRTLAGRYNKAKQKLSVVYQKG